MMERLLMWPAGPDYLGVWAITMPDDNVYMENLSAEDDDGPDKVVFLGDACKPPRAWSGSFNRFHTYIDETDLYACFDVGKHELE